MSSSVIALTFTKSVVLLRMKSSVHKHSLGALNHSSDLRGKKEEIVLHKTAAPASI